MLLYQASERAWRGQLETVSSQLDSARERIEQLHTDHAGASALLVKTQQQVSLNRNLHNRKGNCELELHAFSVRGAEG